LRIAPGTKLSAEPAPAERTRPRGSSADRRRHFRGSRAFGRDHAGSRCRA
jgi:hypothetical protein